MLMMMMMVSAARKKLFTSFFLYLKKRDKPHQVLTYIHIHIHCTLTPARMQRYTSQPSICPPPISCIQICVHVCMVCDVHPRSVFPDLPNYTPRCSIALSLSHSTCCRTVFPYYTLARSGAAAGWGNAGLLTPHLHTKRNP